MSNDKDREATQEFVIFNALVGHCGEQLTQDNVDRIRDEIVKEMRTGPCAWAFRQQEKTYEPQS